MSEHTTTEGLTEAEQTYGRVGSIIGQRGRWYSEASVERILADRLAAVQAERDAARSVMLKQARRAESAETESAAAQAEVERLRSKIWALGESIYSDEGVEHNEGCEGEPDCLACIVASLRAALDADHEEQR